MKQEILLAFKKLLTLLTSFKTWLVVISSFLLWFKKIDGFTWSSVVIAVSVGRVALEGIALHKKPKDIDE